MTNVNNYTITFSDGNYVINQPTNNSLILTIPVAQLTLETTVVNANWFYFSNNVVLDYTLWTGQSFTSVGQAIAAILALNTGSITVAVSSLPVLNINSLPNVTIAGSAMNTGPQNALSLTTSTLSSTLVALLEVTAGFTGHVYLSSISSSVTVAAGSGLTLRLLNNPTVTGTLTYSQIGNSHWNQCTNLGSATVSAGNNMLYVNVGPSGSQWTDLTDQAMAFTTAGLLAVYATLSGIGSANFALNFRETAN